MIVGRGRLDFGGDDEGEAGDGGDPILWMVTETGPKKERQ